ncbi:hypothetical protein EK21DRAFT_112690 [Setomelanomma holmii]|uniref:Uncharacterized protein n=1 Tax=Setomelanomma holmii TaxID=210430 RepID=A0A9P4H9G8_9PLEO|nr:hypothetical protein EK21DRAFT_112690 [Setomelanomma holmii]
MAGKQEDGNNDNDNYIPPNNTGQQSIAAIQALFGQEAAQNFVTNLHADKFNHHLGCLYDTDIFQALEHMGITPDHFVTLLQLTGLAVVPHIPGPALGPYSDTDVADPGHARALLSGSDSFMTAVASYNSAYPPRGPALSGWKFSSGVQQDEESDIHPHDAVHSGVGNESESEMIDEDEILEDDEEEKELDEDEE